MGDLFEALLPGSESEGKRNSVSQPWWAEEGADADPNRKSDQKETPSQSSSTTSHALLSGSEDEDVFTINIDDETESNNSNDKKPKASHWWLEDDDKESNDDTKGLSTDWEKLDATDVLNSETDGSGSSKLPLLLSILIFVSSGVLNVIYGKLQMIPMYNYPSFLSVLEAVMIIPVLYSVFLPMAYIGQIPASQFQISKWPFVLMGLLDGVTGLMQVFASDYLSGPLIALLPQTSIPISMILSKLMLKSKYTRWQIWGAAVVILGITIALGPELSVRGSESQYTCLPNLLSDIDYSVCKTEVSEIKCLSHLIPKDVSPEMSVMRKLASSASATNGKSTTSMKICKWEKSNATATSKSMSTLIWSAVMILSCVPASISNIYKEGKMDEANIDPIYLTTWVANFQAIITVLLLIPSGLFSSHRMLPKDWIENFYHGFLCYIGHNTITSGDNPDQCQDSMFFVNMFVLVNFICGVAAMYVLQYGSSNIMFISATAIVPVSNLAFALPSLPGSTPVNAADIWGLVTILVGISCYHFGPQLKRHS